MKEQIKSWKAERIARKMAHKINLLKRYGVFRCRDLRGPRERKQSLAQIANDLLDYDKTYPTQQIEEISEKK